MTDPERLALLEWQLLKLDRLNRRNMATEQRLAEMAGELHSRILEFCPPPPPQLTLVSDDQD